MFDNKPYGLNILDIKTAAQKANVQIVDTAVSRKARQGYKYEVLLASADGQRFEVVEAFGKKNGDVFPKQRVREAFQAVM